MSTASPSSEAPAHSIQRRRPGHSTSAKPKTTGSAEAVSLSARWPKYTNGAVNANAAAPATAAPGAARNARARR
jgi:hypothetical protein